MDDRIGYKFAFVGDPVLISSLSAETAGQLKAMDVAVVADDSGTVKAALAPLDATVMLVRPDRYLVGAAMTTAEVDAMVLELTQALH